MDVRNSTRFQNVSILLQLDRISLYLLRCKVIRTQMMILRRYKGLAFPKCCPSFPPHRFLGESKQTLPTTLVYPLASRYTTVQFIIRLWSFICLLRDLIINQVFLRFLASLTDCHLWRRMARTIAEWNMHVEEFKLWNAKT